MNTWAVAAAGEGFGVGVGVLTGAVLGVGVCFGV